jgi:peptidyl-prolyl cis-trans isomerase-like 3
VIDGWDVLNALEKMPVDRKYRPIAPVHLERVTVHANPIADESEQQ